MNKKARQLATLPYDLEERIRLIEIALHNAADPPAVRRERELRKQIVKLKERIEDLEEERKSVLRRQG